MSGMILGNVKFSADCALVHTRPDEAKDKVKKKARGMKAKREGKQIEEKGFGFYLLWWHRIMSRKERKTDFFVMCAKRFLIKA